MSTIITNSDDGHQKQEKPYFYERYLRISHILSKMGISDTCRTFDCNHADGCFHNVMNQTFKGLALGYAAKTTLNLFTTILAFKKLSKNPMLLFHALFNHQSFRFGLFPGVYNFVMQSLLCIMRRYKVNKQLQSFISGFLGGFAALATRQIGNRQIWGIFLLSRAVDCIYKSLCNRNIIKKRSTDYTLMFSTMYLVFSIAYSQEPECLPHSFNKFLRVFSCEHTADLQFRRCWIEKSNIQLIKMGIKPHDAEKGLILNLKKK